MKPGLAVRKFKLGQEPPAREEWRDKTSAERVLEVERLRRMAVGLTGDPDVPGKREVTGRRHFGR
ncbi:hypothetical protein [Deinococcus aerius]|uniref:hypothetical protein n=1 Tax=Deinococcus aerius TaxID=200253 RepID=UPI000CCC2418|nr:hypothetical protein [Deinococcus aerius]